MTARTSNANASSFVQKRIPFIGSNTFGEWKHLSTPDDEPMDSLYIVYSYGPHFPLFIFSERLHLWFENSDKYSVSTSKHRSQLRPMADMTALTTVPMQRLIRVGAIDYVARRLEGETA